MAIPESEFLLSNLTSKSAEYYQRACEVIPGGVTANIKYFAPHPIVMKKGKGSKLYDLDGNEYIDYLLSYGALILGHGHPDVLHAVENQIKEAGTTIFGTPHELETIMAQTLIDLYPGIEMVRYTNSGLEATLLAIRIAMAYTGKKKLAKFEGHYHGGYNQVLLSVNPNLNKAGEPHQPQAVPESPGIPDYYVQNTIILPFNDIEATENILCTHKNDIAAVILEPVQGGFIPAEPTFMKKLRKLTEELDIVLIFDEVKTGFRVSLGGAQEVYGVKPDLTALGKVLGGGFPIGAVGGKRDIMMISAPNQGRDLLTFEEDSGAKKDPLFHSGTYNGHPTVLAAGLATIEVLKKDGVMDSLFNNTNILRQQLETLYHAYGFKMQTLGMGSIFNIILTDRPIRNYRDMLQADMTLRKKIDYELLKAGVYIKPLNRYSMSIVHDEKDIERTIEAHEIALKNVTKL
ncbi:aspartate aminotransferase family protein [Saccharococcus caldoxylosilyticus]|uniref:aspartate aminotransferase family protein n=1 Tax=Saccharococcus caldoxylosilyticus TaxID=81408 RepID=UPI0002D72C69|nr:aspartate aminotransferase family protein [Parageobacillus caldoxylosilyticus]